MLTLVATPIGNLGDISKRALECLSSSDFILCEDTRRSQILLEKYGIQTRLVSYHKFKEKSALEGVLNDLRMGKKLALISDAGTPCINDPGQILVDACHTEGIPVTSIPGASSPILALTLTGFAFEKFQYIGFLPKKPKQELRQALFYDGVTVALDSPERLVHTLEILVELAPERNVAVCREMTKTFEECRRGKAEEILKHYLAHPPKGEIVLVIAAGDPPEEPIETEELVALLQKLHGLTLKEAIRVAAKLKNEPKRNIYQKMHTSQALKP